MCGSDQGRFQELCVFAEDAEIPLPMAALLWHGSAGLAELSARLLCERLDGLSLVSITWAGDTQGMVIHDVIRECAASCLGGAGLVSAHRALLDAGRSLGAPAHAVATGPHSA